MTNTHGTLLVMSGPSGSGKSTAKNELLRRDPSVYFSVSATTRAPRPEDIEGVTYHFVTRERFDEMVANNELLEHAEYVGSCYGTPAAPIDAALAEGRDVLLDIEVQGAMQIRARRPDAVLVFLLPPSYQELRRRLVDRGDTAPEVVEKRLKKALEEIPQAAQYDYIVVSETVESAADELQAILRSAKYRAGERAGLIDEFVKEVV